MKVEILRLFHRSKRDKRVTTHCGLVGRAFGASGMYVYGDRDEKVLLSIKKVNEKWGGDFFVEFVDSWKNLIKKSKEDGKSIINLTMYGIPLPEVLEEIQSANKDILVIIGSEKVPLEVYLLSDYNISIGNQPHSEIAALAIFLDRIFNGSEFYREFKDAKLKIVPQEKGKKIIQLKNSDFK
ncbi:MAG: tRNA (cytidine(56)-2'-O)-methyltransferase [Nitrososphaeria archaeon]|jgi:tRNA (cytidine56-2'-O)-methyltransferase